MLFCNLQVFKDRRDLLDPQEIKVTVGVKALQVLQAHPQAHQADQDQADGLVDQEAQPWKKQQTLSKDLPMIHLHRHHQK